MVDALRKWNGEAELLGALGPSFRKSPSAAVTIITPIADLTAAVGAAPHRTFEIGSLSKTLTGMLYRDAMTRGVLSQTTTLRDSLPLDGVVGAAALSSLATHSSGLPGLPPGMHPLRRSLDFAIRGTNPYGDSLVELLKQTRSVRVGPPRPRYSNLGFQLLGHAVASATGTSYAQLLRHVFGDGFSTPAGPGDLGEEALPGLSRLGRRVEPWVGEALAPAGGVRATIGTMRGFLRSVLDGTAPGLAALEPVAQLSPRVGIGAAWITLEHSGRSITWHNGSTGGFSSWMGVDRDAGAGVVVLAARHRSVDREGFRLLSHFAGRG